MEYLCENKVASKGYFWFGIGFFLFGIFSFLTGYRENGPVDMLIGIAHFFDVTVLNKKIHLSE